MSYSYGTNSFLYSPQAAFIGNDSFSYTVFDGAAFDTATISIAVVNTPPLFTVPQNGYRFNANVTAAKKTIIGKVTATDADNDQLTYSIVPAGAGGPITVNANTGELIVSEQLTLAGNPENQFQVRVSDGVAGDQEFVTVTVNPNVKPEFQAPKEIDGKDVFEFTLGEGSREDDTGPLAVTDPDNVLKDLTFTITGGNKAKHFKFWGNKIRVDESNPLPLNGQLSYTLQVEVKDPGGLTDTATVSIELEPLVLFTGDIHAVEGNTDTIELKFVRISSQVDYELDVEYKVTWGSATADDFDDPDDLITQGQTTRTIKFAPGQRVYTLPKLRALKDNKPLEGIETFRLEIINGDGYTTGNHPYQDIDADHDGGLGAALHGFQARNWGYIGILEGVTLFGGLNTIDATLVDPAGSNGAHYNDIRQGSIGDCYFLAAIGSLATPGRAVHYLNNLTNTTDALNSRFYDIGNGKYRVRFWPTPTDEAHDVIVDLSLDFGWTQAGLTGDTDANGNVETWPIIFEKAYRKFLKDAPELTDRSFSGGRSSDVWQHMFQKAGKLIIISDDPADGNPRLPKNDVSIRQAIQNRLDAGQNVVVGTVGSGEQELFLTGGVKFYSGHAYIVLDIDPNQGVHVYNPHGRTNAELYIPFVDLADVLDTIYTHGD